MVGTRYIVAGCIVTAIWLLPFEIPLESFKYNFNSKIQHSESDTNSTISKFSINKTQHSKSDTNSTTSQFSRNQTQSNENDTNSSISPFSKMLRDFNWEACIEAIEAKDIHKMDALFQELMHILQKFIIMEPKVPIKRNCQAPVLMPPENLNCSWSGYGTAFTGELNQKTPKVGLLVQFGFDVDVLEIYLNEMDDVVDYFFIVESTKSHYRTLPKALMWERVKDQDRFLKFADKIVHFVIDDSENSQATQFFKNHSIGFQDKEVWSMEGTQEFLRWKKFLEWNAGDKFFKNEDIIGFGDADEIPARKMVHMLKHCSSTAESIDVGIWFPYGNIQYAFPSDYPVPGHRFTLGDPTFFTLKSAKKYHQMRKVAPSRLRGKSQKFILGGIHMTHYGYLPYQLIHDLTCSECGQELAKFMRGYAENIRNNRIRELEAERGAVPYWQIRKIVNLTQIQTEMKEIAILPWFYDCNRDRYPVWEGRHDTRLD